MRRAKAVVICALMFALVVAGCKGRPAESADEKQERYVATHNCVLHGYLPPSIDDVEAGQEIMSNPLWVYKCEGVRSSVLTHHEVKNTKVLPKENE